MKKKWIILITIASLLLLLFARNEWTPLLLEHAAYGMPALIQKGAVSDLYIGSSMFRQGLDIEKLRDGNEDPYILAYNGNEPVLELMQLEKLIESGVKIDKLYVDLYVYSAFEEPELSDEKMLLELDLSEKMQVFELIKDRTDGNRAEAFWRIFVNGNNDLLLTWPVSGRLIDRQFDCGGTLTKQKGSSEEQLLSRHVPGISGEMNERQKEAIRQIAEHSEKEGIDLLFIETPKYRTVQEDTGYLEAMRLYTDYLQEMGIPMLLSKETAKALGLNVQTYEFDHGQASFYVDLLHLSAEGRAQFSRQIK